MTAQQIIAASIAAHPAEFRAALIKQAELHDDYALGCRNPRARQGAEAQRNACLAAYDAVGQEDAAAIVANCGTMVVALNVAGKLQALPRHVLTAACVAWDEANGSA